MEMFDINSFEEINEENPKVLKQKTVFYEELEPHPENFFSMGNLEELADDIEINGLNSPIVVCKNNANPGKFQILCGHRRYKALELLREKEKHEKGEIKKYHKIDVLITSEDDYENNLLRLLGDNDNTRDKTSYEKIKIVQLYYKIFTQKRERGELVKGKLAEIIGNEANMPASTTSKYLKVGNRLIEELLEKIKEEKLSFFAAYEVSNINKKIQFRLNELIEQNIEITAEDAKELALKFNSDIDSTNTETIINEFVLKKKADIQNANKFLNFQKSRDQVLTVRDNEKVYNRVTKFKKNFTRVYKDLKKFKKGNLIIDEDTKKELQFIIDNIDDFKELASFIL